MKRRSTLLIRVVISLLLCIPAGLAQGTADPYELAIPNIGTHTDRDGLPQNSIESMTVDSSGRLWAATREGIAVFDGAGWQVVPLPDGVPSAWIRAVTVSPDGSIWAGAEQGGIYRRLQGTWRNYDADDGLTNDQIRFLESVSLGEDDVIVAGTARGVYVWREAENRFAPHAGLPQLPMTAIASDGGALWLGAGSDGLYRCRMESCENLTGSSVSGVVVSALLATAGRLFVGTDSGLFEVVGSQWSRIDRGQLDDSPVTDLLATGVGEDQSLWIATEGDGVKILEGESWRSIEIESGLPNNFVFDLLAWPNADRPEQMFAGTLSGLAEIDLDGWRTVDLSGVVPDRSVVSFLESGSVGAERYWIGTTHGLASLTEEGWVEVLGDRPVFALIQSPDGSILAGTDEGLLKLDGGQWQRVGGRLSDSSISALALERTDEASRLWVGTYGAGVWVLEDGKFRDAGPLPDDRVEAILPVQFEDRVVVFIGTNRGLLRIDGETRTVIDSADGLPNDVVRTIHLRETEGRMQLWVGTGAGAAWAWLGDAELDWRVLDRQEQTLPGRTVYRIEQDAEGRIYLFTSQGISRLELGTNGSVTDSRLFTTDDGLPSNEINFGATMVDRKGRLWAGTPMGAALFDPTEERPDPVANFVVRQVYVDRHPVETTQHYDLDADQTAIGVVVSLIDLDGGESAVYRSRLDGVEEEWGPWTSSPRVEFAGLSAGDYELRLQARDDRGILYGPLGVSFSIATPLWATWWAILSYILLILLITGFAVHLRVRYLQRRTVRLERLVRSRTRDLERSNRELEAANRSLSAMTETDPLTAAKNRRWVSIHFPMETERVLQSSRKDDDLLMVLVDIDHFKTVNDRFGHAVGDRVLVWFKDVLGRTIRDSDTIVRWGGEEFLIIARKTSRDEASMIAGRIVDEVRKEPFVTDDGAEIQLTTSVGIAPFPFDQTWRDLLSWEDVLGLADLCLYTVKRSGRNGWVAMFPGPGERAADMLHLLRESPEEAIAAGLVRVETSFDDPSLLRWPTTIEAVEQT